MNRDDAKAQVGAGWSRLIGRFFEWVDLLTLDLDRDVNVTSVTNRIGMLSIRAVSTDATVQDMLTRLSWSLERDSAKVCEVCGKKGFRRKALPGSPNRCTQHYIELVNEGS